ncbi:MAG: TIGR03085 family protein [Hamadaea sp.]|nr:TIGR03085 family protein [Hamadaea sp.]
MSGYARAERQALATLMAELGPDAATLCAGWTARDLAAHLVLRDRRPDAALGIWLKPLAGHTAKVQAELAKSDFVDLLAQLREPPPWSPVSNPLLEEPVNVHEMFVHHEDLRRARPGWHPRELDRGEREALWRRVRLTSRLALRRFPATVVVDAGEFGAVTGGKGGPRLTVAGDPGELAVFLSGRQAYARVTVEGDAAIVERLRRARLGV